MTQHLTHPSPFLSVNMVHIVRYHSGLIIEKVTPFGRPTCAEYRFSPKCRQTLEPVLEEISVKPRVLIYRFL